MDQIRADDPHDEYNTMISVFPAVYPTTEFGTPNSVGDLRRIVKI
ncbi:MAG: hypothetical protein ACLBM1_12210 [Cuspidothrix sp.]